MEARRKVLFCFINKNNFNMKNSGNLIEDTVKIRPCRILALSTAFLISTVFLLFERRPPINAAFGKGKVEYTPPPDKRCIVKFGVN